jgi:hypothetical protein
VQRINKEEAIVKIKILGALITVAVIAVILIGVLPANAATGILDHSQITPTSATVPAGGPVQFLAQSYDGSNTVISTGVSYQWSVSGGGTMSTTGLFTAGTASGKFNVQVTATQGTLSKTTTATVKVTAVAEATSITNLETKNLNGMLDSYLNSIGFSNFMGAQWQVKNGTGIDIIQAIPGVVKIISGTTLTLLANNQTTPIFDISNAVTLPKGTQLAVNDNIVIIMKNNQVSMVVKIISHTTSEQVPPGWRNHDNNGSDKQVTPPGWTHGKKTGWNKNNDD